MKLKIIICAICTMFISVTSVPLFGQDFKIRIEKEHSERSAGYYIRVRINGPDFIFDSETSKYDYENVSKLPDSVKLVLIGILFEFIDDTSICSNKLYSYPNSQFDGCYYISPNSKEFSIGIEALFIINRIAYFKYVNRISCFPVLYDSKSHIEVNSSVLGLRIMGKQYKLWFDKCKSGLTILSDYHYLNSGQIRWWGNHL